MGQMGPEQSTARRGCVKVLMDMHGSDLFFWSLCFFLWAYLQFGPFLDAKHEQVEVSDGLGWAVVETCIQMRPHCYFHLLEFTLQRIPVANEKDVVAGHFL